MNPPSMASKEPSALISIATRCESVEAFVALFQRFVDPTDHALFVAAREPRPVGVSAPFRIKLRDGTVVMKGAARVLRAWGGDGAGSPWERPGYCIELSGLEGESQRIYRELIDEKRDDAPGEPPAAPAPRPPAEPGPARLQAPASRGDLLLVTLSVLLIIIAVALASAGPEHEVFTAPTSGPP